MDVPNAAQLAGEIVSPPATFECHDELFYSFDLMSRRASGLTDTLRVNISSFLFTEPPKLGEKVSLLGQVRTYQKIEEAKNHLIIIFFGLEILDYVDDLNEVSLSGFICKEPIHRATPLGREICDLMLAVNRSQRRTDYLPCIGWGRLGKHLAKLKVGSKLQLRGRLQSRLYEKVGEDGSITQKVAYEISINQKID